MAEPSDAVRTFPRRHARTRRFTLGAPRSFQVAADGSVVWFLRSDSSEEAIHSLWTLDPTSGAEAQVVDPRSLAVDEGSLPAAEQARRERARESGEGVVSYSIDSAGRRAAMAVGGQVVLADRETGQVDVLDTPGGAFDPRVDPTGRRVAYVCDGGLRVVARDEIDRVVVAEDGVTWGAAEFIAAEEFSRSRGFWWSPDGRSLLAERVDEAPIHTWHIASPVEPWSAPRSIRYPAAGTPNASCSLAIVPDVDDPERDRVRIAWDSDRYPYLLTATWSADAPLVSVLTRDQRTMAVLEVDPRSGATREVAVHEDPTWVEPVPGAPAWWGGQLLTVADDAETDTRRLHLDGVAISPPGIQIRSVVDVSPDAVVVTASVGDPTQVQVLAVSRDGSADPITEAEGVHHAAAGATTLVVSTAGMDHDGAQVSVSTPQARWTVATRAASPGLETDIRFLELGDRGLRGALVLPTAPEFADGPLPVLLDPYGGPHAQRVLRQRAGFATSQWFAEQGFAVLIVDGRGTPGRGPSWEREVRGDLAAPVLEDQVDGLAAAAEAEPRLDLSRVGIRGWSFGGYLAALAVLARPDVFHAAVAGAPVTDWRLYDTGYTERYLGLPDEDPDAYERSDLTPLAPRLERPLMLIHGLADDNVVVAHTLQLSRALLEAGRPHTVLPLSGVTHMTPQEAVAENLLVLQVQFLREALDIAEG